MLFTGFSLATSHALSITQTSITTNTNAMTPANNQILRLTDSLNCSNHFIPIQ